MIDDPSDNPASNAYEFSVSELAFTLKRAIEEQFGRVRVRGELGRVTIAKSGHCYLDIKDDKAVINSIIWKGVMGRLSMRPEEGMEVVCEGKLSTYPGRSNYQLIIESMELAGAGALMALFEKRKKTLAAEGLFDKSRKQDLPFMPRTIGVVTSPTGAVIRDILHRIMDRFPTHVIVWPVLVQGDKAAEQIAAAITGFNHADGFVRPDVLIVARGGGSLEDLWCFNEEIVVRAVAASRIPLISAVGHETDWTLIDYAADYRAPTPTGAAEVAVPVCREWLETVQDYGLRLDRALRRHMTDKDKALKAARLPRLSNILAAPQQRLDLAIARLPSPKQLFDPLQKRLDLTMARMPQLQYLLQPLAHKLDRARLPVPAQLLKPHQQGFASLHKRFSAEAVKRQISRHDEQLNRIGVQLKRSQAHILQNHTARLGETAKLLEAYSHKGVLSRGYALVTDSKAQVIRSHRAGKTGERVTLTFADGTRAAILSQSDAASEPRNKPGQSLQRTVRDNKKPQTDGQGQLF